MQTPVAELRASLEARVARETGRAVVVHAVTPLGGGACQDNYRVEIDLADGLGVRPMALRSDARRSLPGSIDRRAEFAVIGAAVAAGVKTPAARFLMEGLVRPGAWAYLLDWVDGIAIGRRVLRDADLAETRRALPAAVAQELARIHSITYGGAPDGHPVAFPPQAPGTRPILSPPHTPPISPDRVALGIHRPSLDDDLRFAREMVSALHEPRPALEIGLRWLEAHRSLALGREEVLVHGDFRTGNFMVTPAGLTAVLDWEFARWGSPAEDLAWIQMRTWRFGNNKLPIGGFARREPFYEAYEAASGRKVNRAEVHYYEVLGNVRWAAGCVQQGERYLSGEERDLELIAIPRRAVEMEFEALRLIERGPS